MLVNEFGLVGLNAALVSDAAKPAGIDIREVAGGCICCSAGFLFDISLGLLDRVSDRQAGVPRADYRHGTDHHHHTANPGEEPSPVSPPPKPYASQSILRRSHISPVTSTLGWLCWKDLAFNAEKVVRFLGKLLQLPTAQRIKAVLRTEEGW